MALSGLLAEQIIVMFLTMAVGYAVVKMGLFRSEDSRIISNMVVYICSPCVIVNSFQIDMTPDKVQGLLLSMTAAVAVHAVLIILVKFLEKPLGLTSIEKASVIYSNAGYLVIPLVDVVLGEEWVFYTTAYILVQTVLIWTHGVRLLGGESERGYRKILKNPNIIATAIGLTLFLTKIRLPSIPASCIEGFGDMISPASMLVIGMIIGKVKLGQVFRKKRPYLICFLRLIVVPILAAAVFAWVGRTGIHKDAEYILMVSLIATSAPAAAMITQLSQIYHNDEQYASVINVMSVLFCIITMPAVVMLYEFLYML